MLLGPYFKILKIACIIQAMFTF